MRVAQDGGHLGEVSLGPGGDLSLEDDRRDDLTVVDAGADGARRRLDRARVAEDEAEAFVAAGAREGGEELVEGHGEALGFGVGGRAHRGFHRGGVDGDLDGDDVRVGIPHRVPEIRERVHGLGES